MVDLIEMKAIKYDDKIGKNEVLRHIPEDMLDQAEGAVVAMIEAAAEGDDELMMKLLEGEELTEEEIIEGIRKQTHFLQNDSCMLRFFLQEQRRTNLAGLRNQIYACCSCS